VERGADTVDGMTHPPHGRRRIVILGAAGRDFHNFNSAYRDDPGAEVVAFTAAQIPGTAGRRYPASLAGPRYPEGIPVVPEEGLEALVREQRVDEVVLAYSDLSHADVMHLASRALAAGAGFTVLGPAQTMIRAAVPVVAVSAVRTGAGKSPLSRRLSALLRARGLRVAVVRHPMPYGELEGKAARRYATAADLERERCTIEEREEYEPHIAAGSAVFAGVDYGEVVAAAQREADVLLWDGGNNDFPFVRPDLHLVLADALRPEDATGYHPGEACLRMADVVVISKSDAAPAAVVERLRGACARANPAARIVRGALEIAVDAAALRGRRVLVVEDGPTITHGGMPHGAGLVAAQRAGAAAIVDPRAGAAPAIAGVYRQYPHIGPVLPAMGYSDAQRAALRQTIEASGADVVAAATPVDLGRLLGLAIPVVRVRYEYADLDSPGACDAVLAFVERAGIRPR